MFSFLSYIEQMYTLLYFQRQILLFQKAFEQFANGYVHEITYNVLVNINKR